MSLLPLSVVACLALGFLAPLLFRALGHRLGRVLALLPLLLFLLFIRQIPMISRGAVLEFQLPWIPTLGVGFSFVLDGLSMLFVLLITGIGTLVLYYAGWYLDAKEDQGKFFSYMLIFMAAMLGVVMADNLLLLFLFWEITSFSSFLLIGFWSHREQSRYGALKALLVTSAGGLCLMAGLIMVYVVMGTVDIREVVAGRDLLQAHPLYPAILVLLLVAAFTKSAQAPFHLWLPNAMEAPTPVSAYLHSAAMVKAGIYLVARLSPALGGTDLWYILVGGVGIVTLVLGSFLALRQSDLKAILAFSTVSQLGLIISLFGWGTPLAVTAAVFHTLNHSIFKAALFMTVGIVDHETHTRDVNELRGLARFMPRTAAAAGLGALALAGVPPFNGFVSKEMFFDAAVRQGEAGLAGLAPLGRLEVLFPILALVGSVLTFVYSMMLFHGVFLRGEPGKLEGHPHDPPRGFLAPPTLLGALALVAGLVPGLVKSPVVEPAAASVLGAPPGIGLHLWHGVNLPMLMSVAVMGLGLLAYWQLAGFRSVLANIPGRINVNAVYDWAVDALVVYSERLTNRMLTGFIRDYFAWFIGFFLTVVCLGIIASGGVPLGRVDAAPVTWYELLIVLAAAAGAIGLLKLRTRLSVILSLSVIGSSIVALFVVFRAPDLALTLLIVESVSLILFLLAILHLPRLRQLPLPAAGSRVSALISVGCGLAVSLLLIAVLGTPVPQSISQYFLDNSRELGGGYNVVNVILVDFRGLDTMGEITVVGLAALGVYTLLNLRAKKGTR